MFKLIFKGAIIASVLVCSANAADLASARDCVNGVQIVNGKTQFDASGNPLACGPIAPTAAAVGIDPLLLVAGGAVIVGGGIALIVSANHKSNTPVAASR